MSTPRPDRAPGGSRRERWRRASIARAEARFRALLADPRGLAFAIAFVDRVIRPDDPRVAAAALERLSRRLPEALPAPLRVGLTLAGGLGILVPAPAMALVRRGFAREVRHLVDVRPGDLAESVGPLVRVLAAAAEVPLVPAVDPGELAVPPAVRLAGTTEARVAPPTRVTVVADGDLGPAAVEELEGAIPGVLATLLAREELEAGTVFDADPVLVAGSAALAQRVRALVPRARVVHRAVSASVAVVTPAADLERAARALVATARADRDRGVPGATQVLLVDSAAGARFREALADAASDDVAGTRLEFIEAPDLASAADRQAELSTGGTELLYSLAPTEVSAWLARAGGRTLVVNAPAVEESPLAWGEIAALGTWSDDPAAPEEDLRLDGLDERVRWLVEAFQPGLDFAGFARVRAGALSDERAWLREFGVAVPTPSPEGLRRATRYRPTAVQVRLGAEGDVADLARSLAAGVRARADLRVSSAVPLPAGLLALADDGTPLGRSLVGVREVVVESTSAWVERTRADLRSTEAWEPAGQRRVRVIGEVLAADAEVDALAGADRRDDPVTVEGRVELPVFLRPQRLTMATERFGILDPAFESLLF